MYVRFLILTKIKDNVNSWKPCIRSIAVQLKYSIIKVLVIDECSITQVQVNLVTYL